MNNGRTLAAGAMGLAVVGGVSTLINPVFVLSPIALLVVLLLALRAPRFVVLATLVFLPFVGLLRRATGSYLATLDPLTLAAPFLAIACLMVLNHGQGKLPRSRLSTAVAAMVVIGLIEILNPQQGSPVVGLAGAGLFIGPLVWFFLGRRMGDQLTLARLVKILRIVGVVVAIYGVKQLLLGFSSFEQAWISAKLADYQALVISGSTRPFSTFASGAEYSYFLVLGAVLFTVWRGSVGRALKIVIVSSLLISAFYAGSRSIFVTGVAAVIIVALVHRIRNLARAIAICIALALTGLVLLSFVPLVSGESTGAKIRNRTLEGLSSPFDPNVSTLGIHIDAFREGIWRGIRAPLGTGAAAVNRSGTKFGGQSASAEHDVPNVLIAYGWAGGIVLALILVRTYRLVKACVAKRRRDLFAPAVFVLVLFGAWFAGELYAVSALVWFFLGSIDGQLAQDSRGEEPGSAEDARRAHDPNLAADDAVSLSTADPSAGAGTI